MVWSKADAQRFICELVRAQRYPNVVRQNVIFEALKKEGFDNVLIETVLMDVTPGALNRLNYDPEILVGLEVKYDGLCCLPFPLGFDRSGPEPICCFGLPQTSSEGTFEIVYSLCQESGDIKEFVKKYRCVPTRQKA
jgi:hypothetical protein